MSRDLPASLSYVKVKNLSSLSPAPKGAALVVGMTHEDDKVQVVKSLKASRELDALTELLKETRSFKASSGSALSLLHHERGLKGLGQHSHLVVLGVGSTKDCHAQAILNLGGKLAAEAKSHKFEAIDLYLDSLYHPASAASGAGAPKDFAGRPLLSGVPTREDFAEKFLLGFLLGLYAFDRYKTHGGNKGGKTEAKKSKAPVQVRVISQNIDTKKAGEILKQVEILAEAAYLTRDLQTTPGGDMQPAEIARAAQQAGRDAGFACTVWDEKKLKQEGMNGILTVGMGSVTPPRFIIMEHNASKKNLPTVVLVGKGISFDAGGISIKPAAGMEEMKMDMSGSASVIGALYALSKLKAPVRVIGLVASAENMPSGSAVRPGDIYTAHDGQTVEVINTDAEGRLVLADALSYAKTYNPDCVIDIATLTGAVVVALGHVSSGLMGNNAALIDGFKKASAKSGEKVWELPLYTEYADDLKSKVADYRNVGERYAGSQKGGAFLNFFVKDAYPWIHLDVAGTADTPKGQGAHCPPDVGTAVPMRSLVEFTSRVAEYFKSKK